MAPPSAVQRETVSALALLVVVPSAVALLRMRSITRLSLLTAARNERWQTIDIAVVLSRTVLGAALLLIARRIKLRITGQIGLRITRAVCGLLAHLRSALVLAVLKAIVAAQLLAAATAFRPVLLV